MCQLPTVVSQVVDANLLKPGYQHFAEKLEGITSIVRIAIACTEDSPRDRMNAIDVLASHVLRGNLENCLPKIRKFTS